MNERSKNTVVAGVALPEVTLEKVFLDFSGRRAAIIKALTTDLEEFLQQCLPDKSKNGLYLYGHPDGHWEVVEPSEEITMPCENREPTIGINFSRPGMPQSDWLFLVAVHSDAWLMSMTFYNSSHTRLNKLQRMQLFDMINKLPTVTESITVTEAEAETETSSVGDEDDVDVEDGWCRICKAPFEDEEEYWVCCEECRIWYHGACVGVRVEDRINEFRCPHQCPCMP